MKEKRLTSKDIFDMGYAVPSYNICEYTRYWRFREETFKLPANAVSLIDFPPWKCFVAKIEDVRAAADKQKELSHD